MALGVEQVLAGLAHEEPHGTSDWMPAIALFGGTALFLAGRATFLSLSVRCVRPGQFVAPGRGAAVAARRPLPARPGGSRPAHRVPRRAAQLRGVDQAIDSGSVISGYPGTPDTPTSRKSSGSRWRRVWDSNPRRHRCLTGFQDQRHRPLGEPSRAATRGRTATHSLPRLAPGGPASLPGAPASRSVGSTVGWRVRLRHPVRSGRLGPCERSRFRSPADPTRWSGRRCPIPSRARTR